MAHLAVVAHRQGTKLSAQPEAPAGNQNLHHQDHQEAQRRGPVGAIEDIVGAGARELRHRVGRTVVKNLAAGSPVGESLVGETAAEGKTEVPCFVQGLPAAKIQSL